jgi:hypothetical protein
LVSLESELSGDPPYKLANFYHTIKLLAAASENQAGQLRSIASSFALSPEYGRLARAIRIRAELFKQMPLLRGNATPEQAAKMREAINVWRQINEQLEVAVQQMNTFIRELQPSN